MYKLLFSLLTLLMIIACSDLDRDNILDPKNPDGYTNPVVLVEAFVNTSPDIPSDYNRWAVQALNTIDSIYSDDVVVVDYHRGALAYDDVYADTTKHQITELHADYTAGSTIPMGVPDIFIDGAQNRVSGAASAASVNQRVMDFITGQRNQRNYIRIEADVNWDGRNLSADCRIAALANKSFNNPLLRMIAIQEYTGDRYGRRIVSGLIKGDFLPDLKDGKVIEQSIGPLVLDAAPSSVIIAIISSDGKNVLQTLREDL